MPRPPKEYVTCYDAATTVKTQTIYCPICQNQTEFEYKEPPEIKTIIVECDSCSGENHPRSKKSSATKTG
jgi:hypothetical protein